MQSLEKQLATIGASKGKTEYSPADSVKKPPGETAAAGLDGVGAGAAAAATVTPVFTALAAGIEESPWVKAALVLVKRAAPSSKEIAAANGGAAPPPHQQPGGAFIHEVTTAVTTLLHGAAAVTVI